MYSSSTRRSMLHDCSHGRAFVLLVALLIPCAVLRGQVRRVVTANLESGQRLVSAIETRRHGDLRAQAENLAESPTLKAALDTYAAEARTSDASADR